MSERDVSVEVRGKRGAPRPRLSPEQQRRAWLVGATLVVTLTAVGFVAGTRPSEYVPRLFAGADDAPGAGRGKGSAEDAPSYEALRQRPHEANRGAYEGAFQVLHDALPSMSEPVERTPEDYAAAIAARRERRAYDGAPPVIPHAVTQSGQMDCLACHQHGAKIGETIAPMMSHALLENCTQCHAEADNSRVTTLPPFSVENEFVGARSPGPGERAWPGAPPTVPHRTLMRSQCSSCHGVAGLNGLKTPHLQRQSCSQCHAPGAALDQRRSDFDPSAVARQSDTAEPSAATERGAVREANLEAPSSEVAPRQL